MSTKDESAKTKIRIKKIILGYVWTGPKRKKCDGARSLQCMSRIQSVSANLPASNEV